MYHIPLLPNRLKKIGIVLLMVGFLTWILAAFNGYRADFLNMNVLSLFHKANDPDLGFAAIIQNNVLDEIVALFLLAGTTVTIFSKEKNENEFSLHMRLSAIFWALLLYVLILFIGLVLLYDYAFLKLMMYNLFTIPFTYIIRFQYLHYKSTNALKYGK
jgi:hypothetical protein